jgi:hypothetical protein
MRPCCGPALHLFAGTDSPNAIVLETARERLRYSECDHFDEPIGRCVRMVRVRSDVAAVGWDIHLSLDVGQEILGLGLGGQSLPVGHSSHGGGDGG